MKNFFKTFDLSVNRSGKVHLRKSTQNSVSNEVQNQQESEKQPENIKIDTRL